MIGCIRLDIALRTRRHRGLARATPSIVSSSASRFRASNDIVFCAVWLGWKVCEWACLKKFVVEGWVGENFKGVWALLRFLFRRSF